VTTRVPERAASLDLNRCTFVVVVEGEGHPSGGASTDGLGWGRRGGFEKRVYVHVGSSDGRR
jgi:hypothetical protein